MQAVLIILGIALIIYSYQAIKKERKPEKNIKFKDTLKESKEGLNDYKIELGILRRDIAESLTELQQEIIEIKTKLNMPTENVNIFENKENDENTSEAAEEKGNDEESYVSENEFLINSDADEDVVSEINFSNNVGNIEVSKVEDIKNLLEQGLTEDEVCHTLSVSKGEILLVKELFKK